MVSKCENFGGGWIISQATVWTQEVLDLCPRNIKLIALKTEFIYKQFHNSQMRQFTVMIIHKYMSSEREEEGEQNPQ